MFNLFKKKGPEIKIVDRIWISESFKLKAYAEELQKNRETVFIFWFDETLRKAENEINNPVGDASPLLMAREAATAHLSNKQVIMAEHYPLAEKENQLFQKLGLQQVTIWSALDEPLFKRFGSDKIISMMKQLGMKENEPIEHNMISKAIRNAQEKIADKVSVEQSARSQEDWLEKNFSKD
ncbi:MAG TPA: hypothetical protein VF476_00425 [Chitinophagaceae bacterium]